MAAPKAPVLGGKTKKEHALDESVFTAEVKPHLVHEAVRAEANARRAGTSKTKSRGMVAGGRSKPWRQKGTGKARAGTIRAPQFEGGGHAFAKVPRTFHQKVNRKVAKAALRSALSSHVNAGTLALVAPEFDTPSTKKAAAMVEQLARPIMLVCTGDETTLGRSFRNLDRVAVVDPNEVEVGAIVWARSLLVSEAALSVLEGRAR